MRLFRSDLPLAGDATARFLPWIMGCMVYLAALTLVAALAADKLADRWHADLAGNFSVLVPPAAGIGVAERTATLSRLTDALAANPGTASARLLGAAEKLRLLEPWLGETGLPEDILLPDLIVVRLANGAAVDFAALERQLRAIADGVAIEQHSTWQRDLVSLTRAARLLAAVVIGLIVLAATATVIFVTHTGLAIHRRVIEIVHLVGARDSYIARQFLLHAMRLGLVGGAGGVLLAALTFWAVGRILGTSATGLLPLLTLDMNQWLALIAVPIAVSAVGMITAHVTVLVSLGRDT